MNIQTHTESFTNVEEESNLAFDFDKDVVLELLQDRIYSTRTVAAQEYPSNGRDGIRKLLQMPAAIAEDIAVLEALEAGKTLKEAVKHMHAGVEKGSVPMGAHESVEAEYKDAAAWSSEQRQAALAQLRVLGKRVDKHLKAYEPRIVMDLAKQDVVRFTDNGCGMTRDVLTRIFKTYGKSDKRGRRGEILTGGFGLGSKSAYSIASNFLVITKSIEDDKAYIVNATKEGLEIADAPADALVEYGVKGYGTLVEIPVADRSLRASFEQKFRSVTGMWVERCIVKQAFGVEQVTSQAQPAWALAEVVARVREDGWEAVLLPRRAGANNDEFYVDGIPYVDPSVTSFVGFRLVVNVLNPRLLTLPATREYVTEDKKKKALVDAIVKAMKAEGQRLKDAENLKLDSVSLAANLTELAESMEASLRKFSAIANGGSGDSYGEPSEWQGARLTRQPADVLLDRAFRHVETLLRERKDASGTRVPSFRGLLTQEWACSAEDAACIALMCNDSRLGEFTPRKKRRNTSTDVGFAGKRDATLSVRDWERNQSRYETSGPAGTVRYTIPTWVRFRGVNMDSYDGREVPAQEYESNPDATAWDARQDAHVFSRLFLPTAGRGRTRYFVSRSRVPENRDEAVATLLNTGVGAEWDARVKEYVGEGALDEVVLIVAKTGAEFEWLEHWGVLDVKLLPMDKRVRPDRPLAEKTSKVTVLGNGGQNGARGQQVTLDLLIKRAKEGTRIVMLQPDEEKKLAGLPLGWSEVHHAVPRSPDAGNWVDEQYVYFVRKMSKNRLEDLEESDVDVETFDELLESLQSVEGGVAEKKASGMKAVSIPLLSLLDKKARGSDIAGYQTGDGRVAPLLKALDEDAWMQHMPVGARIVPGPTQAAASKLAKWCGKSEDRGLSFETVQDFVLKRFSTDKVRLLLRMSAQDVMSYLGQLKGDLKPEDVFVEVWCTTSERDAQRVFDGKATILKVAEVDAKKDKKD